MAPQQIVESPIGKNILSRDLLLPQTCQYPQYRFWDAAHKELFSR
jgi:hypothetical protein